MREYLIAWVLASPNEEVVAWHYFDEIVNHYSSICRVTYTFGRIGTHFVVLANPASDTETHSTEYIIEDLLAHAPSIRAGFLVSTDAVAPQAGLARVGDIVVGGKLGEYQSSPLLEQGVVHLNFEKRGKSEAPVITGRSRNVPDTVAWAVRNGRNPRNRTEWQRCRAETFVHTDSSEAQYVTKKERKPQPRTSHQNQRKALLGVIASSRQNIVDIKRFTFFAAIENILCFETSAATMGSYPFLVVAGIAKYWEDAQRQESPEEICKAIISYLIRLLDRIDISQLKLEYPMALPFQYEPVDLDQAGFRLLRLRGGTGQLQCQIFQASLNDKDLMPYEALSYCWGDTRLSHSIRLNGKTFPITFNLYVALEHLRFPDADRILWIDAICIDQGNVQERGHQVDHMGDVYRHAYVVLFWLGNVSPYVFNLLEELQEFEHMVPHEAWEHWTSGDSRFIDIWKMVHRATRRDRRGLELLSVKGLESLMDNEWFNRVWIIQEVFNAKTAFLGCNEGWIDSKTFALAPILLGINPNTQVRAIIDIMPGCLRRSSWWNQKPNLSTLLWKFRESKATDCRDRVFALLDIAFDKPFRSDYSKDAEVVAKDLMAYMCRDHASPRLLTFASITELQNMIPSLLYMDLDQFGPHETQLDVTGRFMHRHNKQVFMSEAAISYLHFVNPPLQGQLLYDSSIVHVISSQTSRSDVPIVTESLADYLNRKNKGKPMQTSVVRHENDYNLTSLLLKQNRDDITVTEILAIEAAKSGPVILERFLNLYGDRNVFTQDLNDAAAATGRSKFDLLLDKYGNHIKITDEVVAYSMERGPEAVRLLIDMHRSHVEIADAHILETSSCSPDTTEPWFQGQGEQFMITQRLIKTAIECNLEIFELLLNEYDDHLEFGNVIIKAAFENGYHTFKLLTERFGNKVRCTDEMVQKAIDQRSSLLEIILDKYGHQIKFSHKMIYQIISSNPNLLELLLDRCGNQITYSKEIVCQVISRRPDMLEVLLDRHGSQIKCTDEIIFEVMNCRSNMLEFMLDRYGDRITDTDDMVYRAIKQGSHHILKVVLDHYGNHITYTNEMARKALKQGPMMFHVILDTYGNHIEINDIIDTNFYCYSDSRVFRRVFDRYGDSIRVPADVLNTMSQRGQENNLYLLLDDYGYREDVQRALLRVKCKRAFCLYAARSVIVQRRLIVLPWVRILVSALGGALAQRSQLFAMLVAGDFNELLLHPSLLL